MIKDLPQGAVVQRDGGLYSVSPRIPLGQISPDQLNTINSVVQEFDLSGIRITAGQRMKIQGIPEDKLRLVIDQLGPVGEFCHYYVQACLGTTACRLGMRDSMAMGARLEEFLNGLTLPCKLKVGVSGCSMSCSESFVRDVGLVGRNKGWTVLFGGNGGKRVRKADVVAEDVSDDAALELIGNVLDFYTKNAKMKERTARFVERVGIEAVEKAIGSQDTQAEETGVGEKHSPKGAILQRDKKTYAIVPRTPVGLVTPDILEALARVGRKFEIPIMKITSGQRIALVGLREEQVDDVWEDLKMDIGPAVGLCVHYVQACPGTEVCKLGIRDSLGLGLELEEMFVGKELPAKLKVGVSGCTMCCAESYVRDVGLIGKKKGWTMVVGGTGQTGWIADVLAEELTRQEAIELVNRFLEFYRENSGKRSRSAILLNKIGIDAVKKAIL